MEETMLDFNYLLIIIAVACFTAQFAFTKVFESSARQTALTTFVMLTVTSVIGIILCLCIGRFKVYVTLFSLLWALVYAIIMFPYYIIGIKVLSLGSLAIYSMFMMLGGMLVPFFYGIVFLHEGISVGKIAGSILLTVFIILQAIWQKAPQTENEKSKKTKYLFFVLCLAIFFINGMTGVVAKTHQIGSDAVNEISFTILSCAFIAVISVIIIVVNLLTKNRKDNLCYVKGTLKLKPFLAMTAIGAVSYSGSLLHLKAASNVPASVQFPLVSGGVIVLSALVSVIIFREKLSKKEWLCIAGAFVSTFLFAF